MGSIDELVTTLRENGYNITLMAPVQTGANGENPIYLLHIFDKDNKKFKIHVEEILSRPEFNFKIIYDEV